MSRNYSTLAENLLRRANPDNIAFEKSFADELSTVKYNDVLRYITLAMNGVEPEYTAKSKEAGEKVKLHLKEVLSEVNYEYQGSVMTNTHIKGNSDIDLLVITDKFYSFDRVGIQNILNDYMKRLEFTSYQIEKLQTENTGGGYTTALSDLRENRLKSETKLLGVYDICDTTHAKAIKITNQNLKRDVDIVIANWYDDVNSVVNNKTAGYRGIQVYNKDLHSKGNPDYPFLSIQRINDKSSVTNGRLKKMIRLLKNLKADSSKNIDLSSFDFNAICYDIDISKYQTLTKYMLIPVLYQQLYSLANNPILADNLKSVDGHEYIFRGKQEKKEHLKSLMDELQLIFNDLKPFLT